MAYTASIHTELDPLELVLIFSLMFSKAYLCHRYHIGCEPVWITWCTSTDRGQMSYYMYDSAFSVHAIRKPDNGNMYYFDVLHFVV
jgi:hypothetical protein